MKGPAESHATETFGEYIHEMFWRDISAEEAVIIKELYPEDLHWMYLDNAKLLAASAKKYSVYLGTEMAESI
jgi:hypothetical protein